MSFLLSPRSVTYRVYLIVVVTLLGMLGIFFISIHMLETSHLEERRERAQMSVNHIVNMVALEASEGVKRGEDVAQTQKNILAFLAKHYSDPKDYYWVGTTTNTVIWHPLLPELNGKDVSNLVDKNGKRLFLDMIRIASEKGSGYYESYFPPTLDKFRNETPQLRIVYVEKFPAWNWVIGRGIYTATVRSEVRNAEIKLGSIIGIIALISVLCAYYQGRSISKPVIELNRQVKRMAEGDLEQTISQQERNDELGAMARTVQSFLENLKKVAALEAEKNRIEEMKGDFVSVVSHELRTPLTSIYGSLSLVLGAMSHQLPEQVRQLVTIACKNTERLIGLVNDLLDINKMVSGQMHFSLKKEKLSDLMWQAIEATKPYADKYFVRFECSLQESTLFINIDSARFIQILMNLFSNAAKFSPSGSKIKVTAKRQGGYVRISVRDFGPGIPESFRASIFGRFSQADSSETRNKGGSGLGLYISKQLTERMNGTIGYELCDGGGTEFWVAFPVVEEKQEAPEQPPPSEVAQRSIAPSNPPLVLYIGKNEEAQNSLKNKCAGKVLIETTSTPLEAEFLLQSKNVAMIILDATSPSFSWKTMMEETPSLVEMHLPIIVLTEQDSPLEVRTHTVKIVKASQTSEDQIIEEIYRHLAPG